MCSKCKHAVIMVKDGIFADCTKVSKEGLKTILKTGNELMTKELGKMGTIEQRKHPQYYSKFCDKWEERP